MKTKEKENKEDWEELESFDLNDKMSEFSMK
jgi:hypothetical protein